MRLGQRPSTVMSLGTPEETQGTSHETPEGETLGNALGNSLGNALRSVLENTLGRVRGSTLGKTLVAARAHDI